MILQELVKLCDNEELMDNPDFEPKPVGWTVSLASDGTLLAVRCLKELSGKRLVGKDLVIPRQIPSRANKVAANFIIDNAQYLFGIVDKNSTAASKLERVKKCQDAFRDKIAKILATTKDSGISAMLAFLDNMAETPEILFDKWNGNDQEKAVEVTTTGGKTFTAPQEWESNDLFNVEVEGKSVYRSRSVAEYWHDQRNAYDGPMIRCLITGKEDKPVYNHLPLKVRGAVTSGTPLISVNADAFESQGLARNENAPIGQAAAEKYATALRRLLKKDGWRKADGTHLPEGNIVLPSDITVLFWCDDKFDMDFLGQTFNGDAAAIKALYNSPWKGKRIAFDDTSPFHTVVLSGAQGRIILRDAHTQTVGKVLQAQKQHYDDMDCVTSHPDSHEHPSIYHILGSLKAPGDGGNTPAHLVTRLYMCTINGNPYPDELLSSAINRIRAQNGVSDIRAKIIKAVLNRKHRNNNNFKPLEKEMDTSNTTPAYLLGRLLATLQRVQDQAIGAKADVVDRYLGAASTRPALVFPQLLELHHHHMGKLEKGSQVFFGKLVDEIMSPLPSTFPKTFSLNEQGVFMLGFHHQRAEFWKKKEDRQATSEE